LKFGRLCLPLFLLHLVRCRAKAAEEVVKVQQKAKILEEMLQNQQPGEALPEGDVFEAFAR
jgi:ADP-ribosylation factor-binding protein GGA